MIFRSLTSILAILFFVFLLSACSKNASNDPIRPIASTTPSTADSTIVFSVSSNGVVEMTCGEMTHALSFVWTENGLVATNNGETVYDLKLNHDDKAYSFGIVESGMTTSALNLPLESGLNDFTVTFSLKPYLEINGQIVHPSGNDKDHAVILGKEDGYIDNQVLFGFIDGTSNSERHRIIRDHNMFLVGYNSRLGMHTGRFDDGRHPADVVVELQTESSVKWPTMNRLCFAHSFPNDMVWRDYWPDDYRWAMQRIEANRAWDIYKDGVEDGVGDAKVSKIVILICDTGVYPHEDLGLTPFKYWVAGAYSKNFDTPGALPSDNYGHGTSCAGIAGAMGNNEKGIAGVCWDPYFLSVKCLSDYGWGSWEVIGNAIHYVGEVSQLYPDYKFIANFSLGGGMSDEWNQQAATFSNSFPNTLLLASAGNSGYETYSYPASYAEFYSIGASSIFQVDGKDMEVYNECPYGWGSTWNDKVYIAAPGSSHVSTTGIPWNIMDDYSDENCPMPCPGWYCQYFGGTSAACPHVTGLASLVWNKHLDWTKEEVMQKIHDTTDEMSLPPEKIGKFGSGRINAYRALTE